MVDPEAWTVVGMQNSMCCMGKSVAVDQQLDDTPAEHQHVVAPLVFPSLMVQLRVHACSVQEEHSDCSVPVARSICFRGVCYIVGSCFVSCI